MAVTERIAAEPQRIRLKILAAERMAAVPLRTKLSTLAKE
jgi:hypothetical protein